MIAAAPSARSDNQSSFQLTVFHIYLNANAQVDTHKCCVSFKKIKKKQEFIRFDKIPCAASYQEYEEKEKEVYFKEKLCSKGIQVDEKNKVIICFWNHKNMSKILWQKTGDPSKIQEDFKAEAFADAGNLQNYDQVKMALENRLEKYEIWNNDSGEASKEFGDKYIKPLKIAIDVYKKLASNKDTAYDLVFAAFSNKNRVNNANRIQTNIKDSFNAYCNEKVLDRGVVLKCNKCKRKSKVFLQETKIIYYPEILIFTIDREQNGRKFTGVVNYPHILKLSINATYELYAVSNHSGSLGYGHYWAYVKGVDHNKWYNANDRSISSIAAGYVINKASAIILMYKKSGK